MAETTEIVEAAPLLPAELEEVDLPTIRTLKDWHACTPEQQAHIKQNVAVRRRTAFLLRAEGRPLEEISKLIGITPGHIVNDIRIHVRKLAAAGIIDLDQERFSQLARLDQLMETYFQKAVDGDYDAANVCLALENRRSKLLGLDQPIKMKIAHNHKKSPENSGLEIQRALAEIADRMEKAGKEVPPRLIAAREMYRKRMQEASVVQGTVVRTE